MVLKPFQEQEMDETILTIQGARFSVQIAKAGIGNGYDRALAGSVFVTNDKLAVCVVHSEIGRVIAFAVKDGSYIPITENAPEYPYFSSWEIEAPAGDGSWRSIFSR